jgi:hypothetical protein
MFRRFFPVLGLLLACLLPLPCLHGDAPPADRPEEAREFEIPAGDAVKTLPLFARQSSVPLVYLVEDVRGERTQPVHGTYDAMTALGKMLTGSRLTVSYDRETSALMVRRQKEPPPGASRHN